MTAGAFSAPLAGVRVLDLTGNLPGPYTTFLLRAWGAEVLKVEPPSGDPARHSPRLFSLLNRGKQSIRLDLKREAGRARLLELVEDRDVLVEGFRPGVAERLGCGEQAVRARNPRLVYCSISAYGQTGPRRDEPGHDLNAQALAGVAWLARDARGRPHGLPLPIADLSAALTAAASVCAALYQREREPEGPPATLDVAMVDAVTSWASLWSEGVDFAADAEAALGRVPGLARERLVERLDRQRLHALPHYDVYRCGDGRWLAVGIVDERKFWDRFTAALGAPRLARLPLPARLVLGGVLKRGIGWVLARKPRHHWLRTLGAADLPVSPVLTPAEALTDPHLAARLAEAGGTARAPIPGAEPLPDAIDET